ncbi:hypothetical protein DL96DRAFT_1704226 [Flagelloscypha sp. PMI_526]|nr:hypothetical protein DL96DRAFT_1704226 [Flagelloscypha sp. PMI_526]
MNTVQIDSSEIPLDRTQSHAVQEINSGSLDSFVGTTSWSPLQKTLHNTFKQVHNDPDFRAKVQESHSKELIKPETRKFLEEELGMLCETISRIKRDFENVTGPGIVTRFDANKFHKLNPDGSLGDELIEPLLPQWKEFRATFESLLKKSKQTADGYREVVLEMASTPAEMDDAVKEIGGFVTAKIEDLSKNGEDLSSDFDRLRSEIRGFKTILSLALKDAGSKIDDDIQMANAKIEEIQEGIRKFQTTATVGWVILSGDVCLGAGIGTAIGFGICSLAPLTWTIAAETALFGIAGISTGSVGEVKKLQLKSELTEWRDKLTRLDETNKEVQALRVLFKRAEDQIEDLADNINTISRIWSIVRAEPPVSLINTCLIASLLFRVDANLLKNAIKSCSTAKPKAGLIRQVKITQNLYATLEASLETYATKMGEIEGRKAQLR